KAAKVIESDSEWDQLVAKHADATVFHTSAWSRVLRETYRHEPLRLRFTAESRTDGLIALHEVRSAITGRRGVSLPFSDLCPPLGIGESNDQTLVQEIAALADERKWEYFELRGAAFLRKIAPSAANFYGHTLDLTPGFDEIEEQFAPAVGRNIRKARRSEVRVEITRTEEAILQFYGLLARTRRRHGVPPQSRRFFRNIYRHLLKPGLGFVALAHRHGTAIAGAVFFQFGANAVYKFGASDERQQEFRANNLVMREAIRHLSVSGARNLHFGRTAVDNDGLRRFKLAWGAQEEMIDYFRFERASGSWSTAEPDLAGRARRVFQHLPLAVNRLIGTIAYPHLD
ncbi:MAG: GNAT family N-acetyltransferase, partial [Verrucomicrobiota bacterium]|nr:GNAT family N-acetyltransferase [Verrucomicrobiota bacterium]